MARRYFVLFILVGIALLFNRCDRKDTDGAIDHPSQTQVDGRCVYSSDANGNSEIWKYENGDYAMILGSEDYEHRRPRISPKGDELLFVKSPITGGKQSLKESSLWKVNLLSNQSTQLFPNPDSNWLYQGQANWSTDGKNIVFSAYVDSVVGWQIFISNSEGGELTRISKRNGYNYHGPIFALDNNSIFCALIPENEDPKLKGFEIFEIDVKSGLETRLTNNKTRDYHPAISSDGQTLAFESLDDPEYLGFGKWNIHQLNLVTLEETNLITSDNLSLYPRYSSDGKFVYFVSFDILKFKFGIAQFELPNGPVVNLISDSANYMNVDPF